MNTNSDVFEHDVQLKVTGGQFSAMSITQSYVLTNASILAANESSQHATLLDVITLVRGQRQHWV